MSQREPYDDPTTGSGDPKHDKRSPPDEPANTGSGDPQHAPDDQPAR